ncbi:MAG: SH3 domain-containing protein [Burkholderiaceae bacterium]
MGHWLGAACAALGFAAAVQAQPQGEPVIVKRPADLRESPSAGARSLASLAVQTPLTRMPERNGPWVPVRTAQGQQGWVHMFDVAVAGGAAASGGNSATGALRSITGFFNRNNAPQQQLATSTVGIRGLGAADLAGSQPNLTAVTLAEGLRVDAGAARQFASGAQLQSFNVEPLPVPAPPAAARQQGGSPATGRSEMMP